MPERVADRVSHLGVLKTPLFSIPGWVVAWVLLIVTWVLFCPVAMGKVRETIDVTDLAIGKIMGDKDGHGADVVFSQTYVFWAGPGDQEKETTFHGWLVSKYGGYTRWKAQGAYKDQGKTIEADGWFYQVSEPDNGEQAAGAKDRKAAMKAALNVLLKGLQEHVGEAHPYIIVHPHYVDPAGRSVAK